MAAGANPKEKPRSKKKKVAQELENGALEEAPKQKTKKTKKADDASETPIAGDGDSCLEKPSKSRKKARKSTEAEAEQDQDAEVPRKNKAKKGKCEKAESEDAKQSIAEDVEHDRKEGEEQVAKQPEVPKKKKSKKRTEESSEKANSAEEVEPGVPKTKKKMEEAATNAEEGEPEVPKKKKTKIKMEEKEEVAKQDNAEPEVPKKKTKKRMEKEEVAKQAIAEEVEPEVPNKMKTKMEESDEAAKQVKVDEVETVARVQKKRKAKKAKEESEQVPEEAAGSGEVAESKDKGKMPMEVSDDATKQVKVVAQVPKKKKAKKTKEDREQVPEEVGSGEVAESKDKAQKKNEEDSDKKKTKQRVGDDELKHDGKPKKKKTKEGALSSAPELAETNSMKEPEVAEEVPKKKKRKTGGEKPDVPEVDEPKEKNSEIDGESEKANESKENTDGDIASQHDTEWKRKKAKKERESGGKKSKKSPDTETETEPEKQKTVNETKSLVESSELADIPKTKKPRKAKEDANGNANAGSMPLEKPEAPAKKRKAKKGTEKNEEEKPLKECSATVPPEEPEVPKVEDESSDKRRKNRGRAADQNGSESDSKKPKAFQRVDSSQVEFVDSRLQDNSYWAKSGAETGWGAKAQEVLGQVRGRGFRHEKTKKKRGSYRGAMATRPVACEQNEGLALYIYWKREELMQKPSFSDNLDATFTTAYRNVCDHKAPICTLKEAAKVRGIGAWMLKQLKDFFADGEIDAAKKRKTTRRYLPQKNSAPYALLITLYGGFLNEGKSYMMKQELIDAAELSGLSKMQIQPSNKNSTGSGRFGDSTKDWYSGWSSMKTLISKGLVVKSSCPAKYMLTEEGHETAKECCLRGGLLDASTTSNQTSSQAQPTNASPSADQNSSQNQSSSPVCTVNRNPGPTYAAVAAAAKAPTIMRCERQIKSNETRLHGADQATPVTGTGASIGSTKSCLAVPPLSEGESFANVYSVILILDDRECFTRGGRGTSKSMFAERLRQQYKVDVEVRHLPVGDATWVAYNKLTRQEFVLDFIVERKAVDDLWSSIKDTRYKTQKLRLLRCGITRLIYLIEGDPNLIDGAESIKTAALTTEILEGFDVQRTRDTHDTISRYGELTNAINRRYSGETGGLSGESKRCMSYQEFLEHCSDVEKERVRDVFGVQLMQIRHVTEDIALSILDRYPTVLALAQAYTALEGDVSKQKNLLTGLGILNKNKSISSVVSRNVYNFFWAP
ncbi:hypothetical protein SELMODRAFT_447091 [Selaginella moellendorffii]|uniref:Crossover junction endonuclease MUS81 n=2 Tax=Selaginella moellendorffii TaxID=88036 RepID=D8SWM7_SELML|nr:hypothetical protein SELMODRAFT_447091 [Selaginella moellendorffii]